MSPMAIMPINELMGYSWLAVAAHVGLAAVVRL